MYRKKNVVLKNIDCFKLLAGLDDDSVDLIAVDPPYYKVKKDAWDNQWSSKADFLNWLDAVLIEYARVLKPTGSIYLFMGPHLATDVELLMRKRFKFLNRIIWRKKSGKHNGCCKEALRKYFPQTEHIMFAESRKKQPFAFESLRSRLDKARLNAGLTHADVNRALGNKMAGHWFSAHQWALPSEKNYRALDRLFGGVLESYVDFRARYQKKATRSKKRTFNVNKNIPFTDVWDFKTVNYYEGKHPCEKPADLMEHIVTASSLKGDVVLDTFAGSGTTAIAARKLGRRFVGCEMGEEEFAGAVGRLG